MKSVQSRIEELEFKREAMNDKIKKLKDKRAKKNKKNKGKAIDILGRNVLAKLDLSNVESSLDGLNASDKKLIVACLLKLKPELKDALKKLQSKTIVEGPLRPD